MSPEHRSGPATVVAAAGEEATMLMPGASVTLIGLVAGMAGYLAARGRPGPAFGLGVVGAWTGFLAGALVGAIVDVVLGEGIFVAIIGHTVAVVGAIVALGRFRRSAEL